MNEQATIIEQQNEHIKDLENFLNKEKCEKESLLRRLKVLKIGIDKALHNIY